MGSLEPEVNLLDPLSGVPFLVIAVFLGLAIVALALLNRSDN